MQPAGKTKGEVSCASPCLPFAAVQGVSVRCLLCWNPMLHTDDFCIETGFPPGCAGIFAST